MKLHNSKIVKLIAVGFGVAAAALVFAAPNDVQFGSGSTLVVNSLNIEASGNLESIQVNSGNMDIAVTSGLTFTSNNKTTFNYGGGGITTTFTCGGTSSTLSMDGGGSMPVTPTGSTCTPPSTGGGGGGGATPTPTPDSSAGGGGGGSTPTTPTPTPKPSPTSAPLAAGPTPSPTTVAISQPIIITGPVSVSAKFTFGLAKGAVSSHVKRLQQLLNADPDTKVAASGVGSPGKETNTFGALTAKALGKFQEKYGVAKPGDLGYGYLGPKTRAKLQEIFGAGVITVQPTPAPTPVPTLAPSVSQPSASTQAKIQAIQAQLNALIQQLQKLQGKTQ